jgi:hypothetical protein
MRQRGAALHLGGAVRWSKAQRRAKSEQPRAAAHACHDAGRKASARLRTVVPAHDTLRFSLAGVSSAARPMPPTREDMLRLSALGGSAASGRSAWTRCPALYELYVSPVYVRSAPYSLCTCLPAESRAAARVTHAHMPRGRVRGRARGVCVHDRRCARRAQPRRPSHGCDPTPHAPYRIPLGERRSTVCTVPFGLKTVSTVCGESRMLNPLGSSIAAAAAPDAAAPRRVRRAPAVLPPPACARALRPAEQEKVMPNNRGPLRRATAARRTAADAAHAAAETAAAGRYACAAPRAALPAPQSAEEHAGFQVCVSKRNSAGGADLRARAPRCRPAVGLSPLTPPLPSWLAPRCVAGRDVHCIL